MWWVTLFPSTSLDSEDYEVVRLAAPKDVLLFSIRRNASVVLTRF